MILFLKKCSFLMKSDKFYSLVRQQGVITLILYKYFPCNEYTYKSLAVRGLWCHHPKEMNDPLECLGVIDRKINNSEIERFKELASNSTNQDMRKLSTATPSKINEVLGKSRRESVDRFAFCSLSSNCDDVLMWAHYANSHKGMVIGFELDSEELGVHLQKVKYVDSLPDWNIFNYLKFMEGDDTYHDMFLSDLSVKSSFWSDESEYRIWRKSPRYFKFEEHQIKEIYFGVNCDSETKKVVLEILNFLPDNFQISEMEIDKKTLGLTW